MAENKSDGTETDTENGQDEPPVEKPEKSSHRSAPSIVLVNTGHGKGKSTAAFGTVLRALAQDWPVAVVQFLKSGDWKVGEETICKRLGVEWLAAGDGFTWESSDLEESEAQAVAAWKAAHELLVAGDHRLLVLDEISYALTWGWIPVVDVVEALRSRPEKTSVILTGRDMPEPILDVADTVTEMVNVKHAFDSGILAKKGLDY